MSSERSAGGRRRKVAIVTGGASGIGAALVRALAARGATVVIADLDEAGAKSVADQVNTGASGQVSGVRSVPAGGAGADPGIARRSGQATATGPGTAGPRTASSVGPGTAGTAGPGMASTAGPGTASTAVVDVRDAEAVAELVRRTAAEFGRLDLMFNNAGIAVGGMVEELAIDHWDRVIDVNLRGVVHGVHAAYPLMLGQGSGHIVNTASLAGLVPGPMLAPYAAAKHAVVGLSLALRAEAAGRGVKVSVVCPGFVDTPILGRVNPDLPQTETGANAVDLARLTGRLYNADALAQDVLRGLARNQAVIVAPARARLAWRMTRYAPGLSMRTLTAAIQRAKN